MSTPNETSFVLTLTAPVNLEGLTFSAVRVVALLALTPAVGMTPGTAAGYRFRPVEDRRVEGASEPVWVELPRTFYAPHATPTEENAAADIVAHLTTPPAPVIATADQIKAEAQRRILLLAPSWKQSNMIARTVELIRDHGTDVSAWPAPAQAENTAYQAIWDQIKAIRAHSNTLEATPPALAELPAAGWPE